MLKCSVFTLRKKRNEVRVSYLVASKKAIMLARLDLSNLSLNYIAVNKDYKIPESYHS